MLTDKIQTQVLTHLKETTECDDWEFSGLFVTARQCKVYQLSSKKHSKSIALKIYHDKQTSRQLKAQYRALERFSTSMNQENSKYRVPKAFGSFPEQNFFLMEWVTAPSLDTTLWKYLYHRKRQQTAIKDTYHWLKEYHQCASPTLQEVNIEFYDQQLQRHLKLYDEEKTLYSNKAFSTGIKALNQISSTFKDLTIEHADAHGDFTPTNILIGKNITTGIDIGGTHKSPIENDMALILNYITIDFFNMLAPRHMKKPVDTWEILNTALDAYKYPKDKERRRFFLFVFLYQTLRRWLIINNRNKTKVRLIDKWRLQNSKNIAIGLSRALLEADKK